ncbi:MAG: hypothetical protein U0703_04205 [Anaerolineae bacterium]
MFLALFFFYPLISIMGVSLARNGRLDLSGFAELVASPYYRDTLWFTTWQAAVSTLLTLALRCPAPTYSRASASPASRCCCRWRRCRSCCQPSSSRRRSWR